MSKSVLMIVGVVAILMGIAGLVPAWEMATEPAWHAVVKIIVGIVGVAVAATDKGKE
ncbi:MAG: hypothetical protein BWY19_01037 [bacterium ADurb.Bin212]|nr:MAG: hypothetical protein BWY19_01037 [bacterium ADurb.Bin212]